MLEKFIARCKKHTETLDLIGNQNDKSELVQPLVTYSEVAGPEPEGQSHTIEDHSPEEKIIQSNK